MLNNILYKDCLNVLLEFISDDNYCSTFVKSFTTTHIKNDKDEYIEVYHYNKKITFYTGLKNFIKHSLKINHKYIFNEFKYVCEKEYFEILEYLDIRKYIEGFDRTSNVKNSIEIICCYSRPDMIKYMIKRYINHRYYDFTGAPYITYIMIYVCKYSTLEVLLYVTNEQFYDSQSGDYMLQYICEYAQLDVIKFIINTKHDVSESSSSLIKYIINEKHTRYHYIDYIFQNKNISFGFMRKIVDAVFRTEYSTELVDKIFDSGNEKIMKYAISHCYDRDDNDLMSLISFSENHAYIICELGDEMSTYRYINILINYILEYEYVDEYRHAITKFFDACPNNVQIDKFINLILEYDNYDKFKYIVDRLCDDMNFNILTNIILDCEYFDEFKYVVDKLFNMKYYDILFETVVSLEDYELAYVVNKLRGTGYKDKLKINQLNYCDHN